MKDTILPSDGFSALLESIPDEKSVKVKQDMALGSVVGASIKMIFARTWNQQREKKMENSNVSIHPGVMLKDEYMDYHGLDSYAMAQRIGVEPEAIENLIEGNIQVDEELSSRLGNLMNLNINFWKGLQDDYDFATDESEISLRKAVNSAGNRLTVKGLDRRRIILAAFSSGRSKDKFDSIHSQKIMFFINREVDTVFFGSQCFKFRKHLHGPVDHEFTKTMREMEKENLIGIVDDGKNWKNQKYVLKSKGKIIGESILNKMPDDTRRKIMEIVEWAMNLDFNELKDETCKNIQT